jgi:hypothetical protein
MQRRSIFDENMVGPSGLVDLRSEYPNMQIHGKLAQKHSILPGFFLFSGILQ